MFVGIDMLGVIFFLFFCLDTKETKGQDCKWKSKNDCFFSKSYELASLKQHMILNEKKPTFSLPFSF